MTRTAPVPPAAPVPDMSASDYDYDLPAELIAQEPAARRTDARLMHLPPAGPPRHLRFTEFARLLAPDDLLVLNETKVLPARLRLARASGGAVEALLVRPEGSAWRALLRPTRRLRAGEVLSGGDGSYRLVVREVGAEALVEAEGLSMPDILARFGETPLPPYVRRAARSDDRERYQTVYARVPGAVAAPTAGLHFDDTTLADLAAAGVRVARLVLHVGPGTFRPLPEGDLAHHALEAERYEVPADVAAGVHAARARGARVVAVGTTVVRALESSAAAGWAPAGTATLVLSAAHRLRAVDGIFTGMHEPGTSHFELLAAFAPKEALSALAEHAERAGYLGHELGDSCLILPARELRRQAA